MLSLLAAVASFALDPPRTALTISASCRAVDCRLVHVGQGDMTESEGGCRVRATVRVGVEGWGWGGEGGCPACVSAPGKGGVVSSRYLRGLKVALDSAPAARARCVCIYGRVWMYGCAVVMSIDGVYVGPGVLRRCMCLWVYVWVYVWVCGCLVMQLASYVTECEM